MKNKHQKSFDPASHAKKTQNPVRQTRQKDDIYILIAILFFVHNFEGECRGYVDFLSQIYSYVSVMPGSLSYYK